MTRADLLALVQSVAEAAARCVGAKPSQTERRAAVHAPTFGRRDRQAVELAARAGAWRANGGAAGSPDADLSVAAVLALRERVQRQRDERARMLAADDAALRVLDETARIYDAATVREAVAEAFPGAIGVVDGTRIILTALAFTTDDERGPWGRAPLADAVRRIVDGHRVLAACDAILRRRAEVQP